MSMDRQIQVLRDSNVDLREQITDLNKDIFNYKELLELKNLSSQVGPLFLDLFIILYRDVTNNNLACIFNHQSIT